MQLQPQITFRNLDTSPSVKQQIEERIAALGRFFNRIVACKVVVEAVTRRHRPNKVFHVAVHLTVPSGEIVVNRDPAEQHAHEDVRAAVRDAFDAARRQLEVRAHMSR